MSTVVGNFKQANAANYVGRVIFRPLNPPFNNSPSIITGSDVYADTDASGNFSITLEPGQYRVLTAATRAFLICVPNDEDSYNIIQLEAQRMSAPCCSGSSGGGGGGGDSVGPATHTVSGTVRTSSSVGDPEVYLVEDADAKFVEKWPDNATFRFFQQDSPGSFDLQLYDQELEQWRSLLCRDGMVSLGDPQD